MALFGLTRSVNPEPLLRGDGLYLRPATPADFAVWSQLRAMSRAFLEPWEPTWPEDDLTQAAFRRRLSARRRTWPATRPTPSSFSTRRPSS